MPYRSDRNICRLTGVFGCASAFDWGGKDKWDPFWYPVCNELGGNFIFWMRSVGWIVSFCLMYLYIASTLCNMIQAILV